MTTWTSPRPRLVSLHLWAYRHRVAILAGIGSFLFVGLLSLAYFTSVVVARFDGRRWNLPSRIYSDVAVFHEGDAATSEKLVGKLKRLLYQPESSTPTRAGRFRAQGNTVEIWTRDFRYPGRLFRGFPARVEFAGGKIRALRDASGDPVPALVLEPERLGAVFGEEYED